MLAYPDDEIFHGGVLAHLSERGVRVTLVCATDGEAGKPHPSVGPVHDLGALRVEELRLSCARLGIEEPVLLRFHDSARKERLECGNPSGEPLVFVHGGLGEGWDWSNHHGQAHRVPMPHARPPRKRHER